MKNVNEIVLFWVKIFPQHQNYVSCNIHSVIVTSNKHVRNCQILDILGVALPFILILQETKATCRLNETLSDDLCFFEVHDVYPKFNGSHSMFSVRVSLKIKL